MGSPSDEQLLITERMLRAEADDLLLRRGLRALLEQRAPIHVVGSYALELMVWRDLDLILDASAISIEDFFDLGKQITSLLFPWKMFFTNNREREATSYPRGLYWGIRLGDIRQGAWKIDLWAFDPDLAREKVLECGLLQKRLDPKSRLNILRLKSQLWRDPRYRDEVTSQDIYQAVLDHNVVSLEDLWAHLRKK